MAGLLGNPSVWLVFRFHKALLGTKRFVTYGSSTNICVWKSCYQLVSVLDLVPPENRNHQNKLQIIWHKTRNTWHKHKRHDTKHVTHDTKPATHDTHNGKVGNQKPDSNLVDFPKLNAIEDMMCVLCHMLLVFRCVFCVICCVFCVVCCAVCVVCCEFCVMCCVFYIMCCVFSVKCCVFCLMCCVFCVMCWVFCVICCVFRVMCSSTFDSSFPSMDPHAFPPLHIPECSFPPSSLFPLHFLTAFPNLWITLVDRGRDSFKMC